jgi:hypothetical protein
MSGKSDSAFQRQAPSRPFTATAGQKCPPGTAATETTRTISLVEDDFQHFKFKDPEGQSSATR